MVSHSFTVICAIQSTLSRPSRTGSRQSQEESLPTKHNNNFNTKFHVQKNKVLNALLMIKATSSLTEDFRKYILRMLCQDTSKNMKNILVAP